MFVRIDNCPDKARQLSVLPTSIDIFDKKQCYVHILYASNVSANSKSNNQSAD